MRVPWVCCTGSSMTSGRCELLTLCPKSRYTARGVADPGNSMHLMQGPSWSGVDYGGHWKLLMYAARKFYNPVLISGTYDATLADAVSVYITNDQPWTVSGDSLIFLMATSHPATMLPALGLSRRWWVSALLTCNHHANGCLIKSIQ